MSIKIETPPSLNGGAEAQLKQLYSYLYRLSENLNVALNNLPENRVGGSGAVSSTATGNEQKSAETYDELRSLIVSSAEITRSEMERLESRLEGSYEAISGQWGSYKEQMHSTITATARDVLQSYGFQGQIETLEAQAAGFEAYRVRSEGYIRSGFIDYDSDGVPIVGIAIGQGLTSTTVTVEGEDYEQLDRTQSCAFYTADRVSFRINGTEVAYVSNQKLYIHDVEITGSVVFGGWHVSRTGGLKIKWIGGS